MGNQYLITKKMLLVILSCFFMARIIYSYFFGLQEIPVRGDPASYNGYALAILSKSDWITDADFFGHFRPPGYPMLLAILYSIFGIKNLFAVYLFQATLSTLTAYYVFKLSSSVFGQNKSFLALFWAGFYSFYFLFTATVLRETLIIFLIIFCFYHLWIFFDKRSEANSIKSVELWKFLIGFTILLHTDARYLFYLPFLSILFLVYMQIWIGIKQYLFLLAMILIFLIPWSIRNYITYDGFVLINTRTLDTTKKGISIRLKPLSTRSITVADNKDYPSEKERGLIKKGENPNSRTPEELEIIRRDVYPASTFLATKLYYFTEMWVPFRFWSDYMPFPRATFKGPFSLKHNLTSILSYGMLIPFLLCALFLLFKRKHHALLFLIFPIITHATLHFLMWGRERYRLPVDAFIIILGCYGMTVVYCFLKKKFTHSL